MGLSPADKRELQELLGLACAERLDASGLQRLEHLLENSAEARQILVDFSRLHCDLREFVSSSRAHQRVEQMLANGMHQEAMSREALSGGNRRCSKVDRVPTMRKWGWRPWGLVLAASVVLAIALTVLTEKRDKVTFNPQDGPTVVDLVRPPHPVATLSHVSDAVWRDKGGHEVGQLLLENQQLVLDRGTAQISMSSGADIVLQAPCTATLVADNVVQLARGRVTVQAAKWATGFIVETRGLRVTDLGTRFAMSVDPSGAGEVHVLEGAVWAEPLNIRRLAPARTRIDGGEAMRVNLANSKVDHVAAQVDRFVSQLEQFRPYRQVPIWNTGFRLEVGDADPNWQVIARSDADGNQPKPAFVAQPHILYRDSAPQGSQWISVQSGTTAGVPPDATFTFATSFELTGFDLSTVKIVGQMLADNGVQAVRLNGVAVHFVPWSEVAGDKVFQEFRTVNLEGPYRQGTNHVEIDVTNSRLHGWQRQHLPNPMALRIEWRAFGCLLEQNI